ncbi:MAG: hypothetical protein GTO18_05280 [Anaerolineales bacterium]|nr:hypothetical protein [Anaerolineales bacterium]
MKKVFLGVDIGSSSSHALIVDEHGSVLGFGHGGPGNHEVVGYAGLQETLHAVTGEALQSADLEKKDITSAGFGISGYDWSSEREPTMETIQSLELSSRIALVNDTLLGLIAGAEYGWGIAVVAGSGENCWGRDARGKIGRMTGCGPWMGEFGGASTIARQAIYAVAAEWTHRGPPTSITHILLEKTGASTVEELLEGLSLFRYEVGGEVAPLIVQAAEDGDSVAYNIIQWAGEQLGALVIGVIRQLDFQNETFDIVQMGGVFKAGRMLTGPFHASVTQVAPGARFVPLNVPPVVGAVLLAMEQEEVDMFAARGALWAKEDWF